MENPADIIPVHVASIFDGYVRFHGNVEQLWRKLRKDGYEDRLFVDEFGYSAIRFEAGTPYAKNIQLLTLLFHLNDLGVPFGEDFKQTWSPAEFMRDLQLGLVLRKPFRSITAKSLKAEDWSCKVNEPLSA